MLRGLDALAIGLVCALPAQAEIRTAHYDQLETMLRARIDFEALPPLPEPGRLLSHLYVTPGAQVGEHFAGQSRSELKDAEGRRFDFVRGQPSQPLSLSPGPEGSGLALAQHRGFGSVAAFPIGPAGFQAIEGRGEGALSVVFVEDQGAIGLRLHADYADPLGTGPQAGTAVLRMFGREGQVLGRHDIQLRPGITELGYIAIGPGIAGFTLTNTDPGGLAVDDILFDRQSPLS